VESAAGGFRFVAPALRRLHRLPVEVALHDAADRLGGCAFAALAERHALGRGEAHALGVAIHHRLGDGAEIDAPELGGHLEARGAVAPKWLSGVEHALYRGSAG